MPTHRLTPAQFKALYRTAIDPADGTAQERTLESLCAQDMLAHDSRGSLGHPRPRYVLTATGWQELHRHLSWLADSGRGRNEFERDLGAQVESVRLALTQARLGLSCPCATCKRGAAPAVSPAS